MSILVCNAGSSNAAYIVAKGNDTNTDTEKEISHSEGVFGGLFHRGRGEDNDVADPDEAMTEEPTEEDIEDTVREVMDEPTEESAEMVSMNGFILGDGITGMAKGFGLGLLCAAIVAVVATMILRGRKKGRTTPESPGIPMELVLYSGKCLTDPQKLELRDGLILGSSNKCDIRFEGEGVEPEHAKIIIQDGQAYIEDRDSLNGVTIGGMRIQDRNPIRSGYVIGLGEVEFLLKY